MTYDKENYGQRARDRDMHYGIACDLQLSCIVCLDVAGFDRLPRTTMVCRNGQRGGSDAHTSPTTLKIAQKSIQRDQSNEKQSSKHKEKEEERLSERVRELALIICSAIYICLYFCLFFFVHSKHNWLWLAVGESQNDKWHCTDLFSFTFYNPTLKGCQKKNDKSAMCSRWRMARERKKVPNSNWV